MDLSTRKCVACRAETPTLSAEMITGYLMGLDGWALRGSSIEKKFSFNNFREALVFFNAVAQIAEEEDHHPDMGIKEWRNVILSFTSHAANGLTENDFIMAAKVDKL